MSAMTFTASVGGTGDRLWTSEETWDVTAGSGHTYPIAGDTVILNAASDEVIVTEEQACAILNATGFASTLTLDTESSTGESGCILTVSGAVTINGTLHFIPDDVNDAILISGGVLTLNGILTAVQPAGDGQGNITFNAGAVISATTVIPDGLINFDSKGTGGNLTTNGVKIPTLTLFLGTLTLQDNLTVDYFQIVVGGGTLAAGTNVFRINENFSNASGTVTGSKLTFTSGATIDAHAEARILPSMILEGTVNGPAGGDVTTRTIEGTGLLAAAGSGLIFVVNANEFWTNTTDQTGVNAVTIKCIGTKTNISPIKATNKNITLQHYPSANSSLSVNVRNGNGIIRLYGNSSSAATHTVVANGPWNVGSIIYGLASNAHYPTIFNAAGHIIYINTGGITVTGTNTAHVLQLNGCYLYCTTGIFCRNAGAAFALTINVGGYARVQFAGVATLNNADADPGSVYWYGGADAVSSHANWGTRNTQAPAGSMSMMGAGV